MAKITFSVFLTRTITELLWRSPHPHEEFIRSERVWFGEITAETGVILISYADYQLMAREGRTFPDRDVFVMVKSDDRTENSGDFHFVASLEELAVAVSKRHKHPAVTVTSTCDEAFLREFLKYADTVHVTTVHAVPTAVVHAPNIDKRDWALLERTPREKHPGDAYDTERFVYRRAHTPSALQIAC